MMLLLQLLIPLAGAAVLGLWRGLDGRRAGRVTLVFAALALALTAVMGVHGKLPDDGVVARWDSAWLPEAGIALSFAVDGISWLFLVLTGVVMLFSLAAAQHAGLGGRAFGALALVMQAALYGVFAARHFVPWFLAWELTLIPAYLLIRLWGGPKAPAAALRFFFMTLGGSVFMLVGFLALQFAAGTMDFGTLAGLAAEGKLAGLVGEKFSALGYGGPALLGLIAVCVFLGLAVKLPVAPLHAWLPAAYAEAPTPVTMMLTGLLSKMAVYGFLRVLLPVFPEVLPALAPAFMTLAVATILLGAVAALAQQDMKRILAYSSVNHLGYCAMAVVAVGAGQAGTQAASAALSGTVLQTFNHGIIASTLYFFVGLIEQRSGGARGVGDFGGLRAAAPVFCGLMGVAVFASLGLPGLSGFVGEFLVFSGTFGLVPWAAALSTLGLLLTAVFFLRMMRLVFWGPVHSSQSAWPDLTRGERWLLAPMILLIALPGLWPQVLLHCSNADVVRLLESLPLVP